MTISSAPKAPNLLLAESPEPRPGPLRAFFDFVETLGSPARNLRPLVSDAPVLGGSFTRLATLDALRAAGEEMKNGLAGCLATAAADLAAYFLWRSPDGREQAAVELARVPQGWVLGAMEGAGGQPVSAKARESIRAEVLRAAKSGEFRRARDRKLRVAITPRAKEMVALGRASFSAQERARLQTALASLRSFALDDRVGAVCVWDAGDAEIEFRCEPISGLCTVEIGAAQLGDRLEKADLALLAACGFLSPDRVQRNFAIAAPLWRSADGERLAELACGLVTALGNRRPGAEAELAIFVNPS